MKNSKKVVQERWQNTLKLVSEKGQVTVEEIAKLHGISEMTVRRDLKTMENRELLFRTYGGAISLNKVNDTRYFDEDVSICREKISKFAERYVEDGDYLFINGSRIALNMLKYVKGRKVFVYTNNGWAIGEEYPAGVRICFTGGEIRSRVMIGDYVMRNLLSVEVDKMFIGCAAVYDDGEFRYDIPTEIGINESMVGRTKQKIYVLADHSKLQKRVGRANSYGSVIYEKQIVLVTDDKADSNIVESLRNRGIEVILVY